jgi:hypothetical protein
MRIPRKKKKILKKQSINSFIVDRKVAYEYNKGVFLGLIPKNDFSVLEAV